MSDDEQAPPPNPPAPFRVRALEMMRMAKEAAKAKEAAAADTEAAPNTDKSP